MGDIYDIHGDSLLGSIVSEEELSREMLNDSADNIEDDIIEEDIIEEDIAEYDIAESDTDWRSSVSDDIIIEDTISMTDDITGDLYTDTITSDNYGNSIEEITIESPLNATETSLDFSTDDIIEPEPIETLATEYRKL